MAPRKPLDVNTSSKALRELASACGLSPLCKPCGWQKKAVPKAWKQQLPGTPYTPATRDPLEGLAVTLRGDAGPSKVTGPATPMGPSLLQMGRVSTRYECQGAVMVKTPLGLETPVPRSVVRERARLELPDRQTCKCNGLPYPHRVASSPLCEVHPRNPSALREFSRDAYEEGDDDRAADFDATAARLEQLQEEAYRASEKRRGETKSAYQKRISAAKRDARRAGWKP